MKTNKLWNILMMLTLVLGTTISFSSCGSDDDDDNGGGQTSGSNTSKAPKWVKAVDLGLPSGVKWANGNLGASYPEDYGDHFAWGEVATKSIFNMSNSETYGMGTSDLRNAGIIDFKTQLVKEHDAAAVNWGGSWRIPTRNELKELVDEEYCTWTKTTQNGKNGYKVTSKKNGNSIFLPAAGAREGGQLYKGGKYGDYWSSTPYSYDDAYCLGFGDEEYKDGGYTDYDGREYGYSIRPVSD